MKTNITLFIFFLFLSTIHSQVYVKQDATGNNDGTSWADAYTDPQDAFDNAPTSSQIWIAAGSYKPLNNFNPDSNWFQIDIAVEVYGGFDGTETMLDQRDWTNNITEFTADLNGDDVEDNFTEFRTDNARHVLWLASENVTIDGLFITHGEARTDDIPQGTQSTAPWSGAGIYSPIVSVVRNCTFLQCNGRSGAAFWGNSSGTGTDGLLLENCLFQKNRSVQGGVSIFGINDPEIRNCIFDNNEATSFGGGMTVGNASCLIEDCTFENNSVPNSIGGGLMLFQNPSNVVPNPIIQIRRSTFNSNQASSGGGITYNNFLPDATVEIDSCTFFQNSTVVGANNSFAGAILIQNFDINFMGLEPSVTANIMNSEFTENTATTAGAVFFFSNNDVATFNVINSEFTENSSTEWGGALAYGNSVGSIEDCLFQDNVSMDGSGGAIFIYQNSFNDNPSPSIEIRRTDFLNNEGEFSGGISFNNFYPNSNIIIDSCYFFQNVTESSFATGGGVSLQNIEDGYGGGLSSLSATVTNSIFEENDAINGGGLYLFSNFQTLTADVSNNEFIKNTASRGGGVAIEATGTPVNADFLSNTFTENATTALGGAAYFFNADDVKIDRNIFDKNTSDGNGAAMSINGTSNVRMENSLLVENQGASSIGSESILSMLNVTMLDTGVGIFQSAGGELDLQNTILACSGNNYVEVGMNDVASMGSNVSNDDTMVDFLTGAGNYDDYNETDPELGSDYVPEQNSVCVDLGNPDDVTATEDLAGNNRTQGNGIDIGALESPFTVSNDDLAKLDIDVYPNPFVDKILISKIDGITSLRLLDILGKEVQQFAVQNELFIQSDLSQGMYLLELNFDGERYFKKVEKID